MAMAQNEAVPKKRVEMKYRHTKPDSNVMVSRRFNVETTNSNGLPNIGFFNLKKVSTKLLHDKLKDNNVANTQVIKQDYNEMNASNRIDVIVLGEGEEYHLLLETIYLLCTSRPFGVCF